MMDKFIYNETNGLWYELQGDYYLPCLKLPKEEWRISAYGDSGLSFFNVFHRTRIIFKPALDSSEGVCYTIPRYDIFGRKGIFELEHIKESRENEKNDWYMS